MSMIGAFFNEGVPEIFFVSLRRDGHMGTGLVGDPVYGGTSLGSANRVHLEINDFEAVADSQGVSHGLSEGDMVQITGVTGPSAGQWNQRFTIYDVTPTTFMFARGNFFNAPNGNPVAQRLIFHLDSFLNSLPPGAAIKLAPCPRDASGNVIPYETRGFAPGSDAGWQPKSWQKVRGAGYDATVIRLVGASVIHPTFITRSEQHFHAFGMALPEPGVPVAPLEHFEVSDLTIDCNVDNQHFVEQDEYPKVACGAVRIYGNHCRIRNVKAINFGTKTLEHGCHVFSMIGSSPAEVDSEHSAITSNDHNVIEDCIAVEPSPSSIRETTVLHIGSVPDEANGAVAFHSAAVIRRNFVDCRFIGSDGKPHPSAFVASGTGTTMGPLDGTFVGKRPHYGATGYRRFYQPLNPASKWNGYFKVTPQISVPTLPADAYTLSVAAVAANTGETDSSLVVMGTEFRGISVSAGINAVIEQNQIHNCWIGGPYQGLFDDERTLSNPPSLHNEERLDPWSALNSRSMVVRDNHYRNVAVGPYFNMGNAGPAVEATIGFSLGPGVATIETETPHKLWVGAWIRIDSAPDPRCLGVHVVTQVFEAGSEYYFNIEMAPGLEGTPAGEVVYRLVSGVDFLVIEGNQIGVLDIGADEFGVKLYPLAWLPGDQVYRACGIVVADNELPNGFAHRTVLIRNNKINYPDNQTLPTFYGAGTPAGVGMHLAGIEQLHVTHNVLELNPRGVLRAFRCGKVRAFNNKTPQGEFVPVKIGAESGHYDEPETLLEDAFILSRFQRLGSRH